MYDKYITDVFQKKETALISGVREEKMLDTCEILLLDMAWTAQRHILLTVPVVVNIFAISDGQNFISLKELCAAHKLTLFPAHSRAC